MSRRPLAGVALATLLPLVVLAMWARLSPVEAWERALLATLALAGGPFDGAVYAINVVGDLWLWSVLTIGLAALALLLRRMAAAALIGLTLLADAANFAVKLFVERARPEGALVEHLLGGETFAFPSGHVARVTALAGVVAWLLMPPRLRLPAALAVAVLSGLAMGYARVALGVHWPSDVLGGLLLGLAWFAGSAWLISPSRSDAEVAVR